MGEHGLIYGELISDKIEDFVLHQLDIVHSFEICFIYKIKFSYKKENIESEIFHSISKRRLAGELKSMEEALLLPTQLPWVQIPTP